MIEDLERRLRTALPELSGEDVHAVAAFADYLAQQRQIQCLDRDLTESEHARIVAALNEVAGMSNVDGLPVSNRDHDRYLYGGACWSSSAKATRSFALYGGCPRTDETSSGKPKASRHPTGSAVAGRRRCAASVVFAEAGAVYYPIRGYLMDAPLITSDPAVMLGKPVVAGTESPSNSSSASLGPAHARRFSCSNSWPLMSNAQTP